MVQDSEGKAYKFLRGLYGKAAYIKKIPDFKQTGLYNGGLPDYLVIYEAETIWYEIKKVNKKELSITQNDFTDQQLIEFRKMTDANANIIILIYFRNCIRKVTWKTIYDTFKTGAKKYICGG